MSLPAKLLAIADRISAHATASRSRAARLSAAIAAAGWHGLAADAFHVQAGVVLNALWHSAGRLDDAADALRRHARNVAETLDDLHRIADDGAQLVHDGITGLRDLATDPGDLVDAGRSVGNDITNVAGGVWDLVAG